MVIIQGEDSLKEEQLHSTSLAVWDIANPVESGTVFKAKLGAKCHDGCSLAGIQVTVFDAQGLVMATGILSDDLYSDTVRLYWAEVEMLAPAATGQHTWEVLLPERLGAAAGQEPDVAPDVVSEVELAPELELAPAPAPDSASEPVPSPEPNSDSEPVQAPSHASASASFSFSVTKAADSNVTIITIDESIKQPVANAHVMLRPYSGYTDADGALRLRVSKGSYRLCITVDRYEDYFDVVDLDDGSIITIDLEPSVYMEDYRGNICRVRK